MKTTLGIDPGLDGAYALLSGDSLFLYDMPTMTKTVGRISRRIIDPIQLIQLTTWFSMCSVSEAILEEVGGRPSQNAAAAFNFGVGYGYVYMALMRSAIPIRQVLPAVWKKAMGVRGKNAGTEEIIVRADEHFPRYSSEWRGKRGGFLDGRAEAALIAKYGTLVK